ncbi:helix-turn-helix transcriptional regulator [Aminipila luticellarii]|uniref:HTH luxR-type domain-containing protein n=1 Tax=Aminipila luticellarii TaxID=2507160 RepID=A0A410PVN5_9FIRM|nr:LuxR C-terminal-related transcriptional regulator [Aminipila luticellarii]QAT42985.1 hypothetical protein EQM06_06895 [Aminipila luticellarii]
MASYPRLNDIFITERLKERLSEIGNHPITTVIAPMGFGKTTAVNWWAKRLAKSRGEAVVLRQMIVTDSVTDFWSGFCRAFKGYPQLLEEMKALGYPKDVPATALLSELLHETLSASSSPLYFIMDDLHLLEKNTVTALLLLLSRNLPDCVHLILLSRNQIFSEEERMRLGHLLCEIGADDLRLNARELKAYADRCGLAASPEELDTLVLQSEGWISMIYLNFKSYAQNGHWLSSSSDIFDLIHQVLLVPLESRQREFLILIGMTDEFTAGQAAYLWQHGDAQSLLDSLTKNNAFITRSEQGIYRYHHMLRHCVRLMFAEKPEGYRQESYSRLGKWHLKEQEYIAAYFAFAAAYDWVGLLATLTEDNAKSLNSEHSRAFVEWSENCPKEILLQNPAAIVVFMLKLFSFHCISEIKQMKKLLLVSLEQNTSLTEEERNNILGDAEVAESLLAYNDISAMSVYHRRACLLLRRSTVSVDSKGTWTFSSPSIFMSYHRRVSYADSESAEMKECMPYYYQVSNGHGNGAEHSFAADLFYERGEVTDADISNRMARSAARRKNQYSVLMCCEFLDLRMAIFQGNYDRVKQKSHELREWLYKERQYALLNTLDMCLGFLYSLLGFPEYAPKWFAEGKLSEALIMFPATPMLHTFYNQLLLAQEEWTEVIARQEECKALYGIYHNVLCEIRLHIQLSAALEQLGRRKEALDELKLALDSALPDGIVMPFAESGAYLLELLKELKGRELYTEEIEKICSLSEQFHASREQIRREHFGENESYGLSERELIIARLAAQRKTNREIAEELHLAEGTVRNQLSRIFDKLGLAGDGKNKRILLENLLKNKKQ